MLITGIKPCFPSWCKFYGQSVIECRLGADLVNMNAGVLVLLFRESTIQFWEDKIMITRINEHFERLSRVA